MPEIDVLINEILFEYNYIAYSFIFDKCGNITILKDFNEWEEVNRENA